MSNLGRLKLSYQINIVSISIKVSTKKKKDYKQCRQTDIKDKGSDICLKCNQEIIDQMPRKVILGIVAY